MDPQPNQIDQIFHEASRIESAAERSEYLERVCGDDADLRGRVERLLAAQVEVGSFVESPAPGAELGATVVQSGSGDSRDACSMTEMSGAQIGPYKLLQKLGEGGMGVVYMAEQTEPVERRVALKIIKPGMDTRQVIARFEAERQALAMMDHPNIAHVVDAGTTDSGRPFFAMELVKGTPITTYCDEHKLTVRERLELFVHVNAFACFAASPVHGHRLPRPVLT
jgi:serine/threonine protein kinase